MFYERIRERDSRIQDFNASLVRNTNHYARKETKKKRMYISSVNKNNVIFNLFFVIDLKSFGRKKINKKGEVYIYMSSAHKVAQSFVII